LSGDKRVLKTSVVSPGSPEELVRLTGNWRALLEALPGMVVLAQQGGQVEYMNAAAKDHLGNFTGKQTPDQLEAMIAEGLTRTSAAGAAMTAPFEGIINDLPLEYAVAPFTGYRGDQLVVLLLYDISLRKEQEREIENYQRDIESVLRQKIEELKENEQVRSQMACQLNALKTQLGRRYEAQTIIGNSSQLRQLRDLINQVADSDATILITGESGTGKELVANLVHSFSRRVNKPFLKINCNTINDSILESDLFGYEKGSFTGAAARKKGKFEVVDGGTIFLDEIGDISPRMQASLLRVLQNGEVVRVGGTEPVKVDVRIIAATNVDLAKAVQEKKFRLDLFYRLNIINVPVPPLREHKEDLVDLVAFFIQRYREAFAKDVDFVPQAVIDLLLRHDWPGNVRELESVVQRAVLMAKGRMLTEQDVIFGICPGNEAEELLPGAALVGRLGNEPLKTIMADFERDLLVRALDKYDGDVAITAAKLSLGKTALYDKMRRYNITGKTVRRG